MQKLVLSGAFCAGLLFASDVVAHGGSYRGPGDLVPPNPGGSRSPGGPGPTTPGPNPLPTPGPVPGVTGGPTPPPTPGPSPTGGNTGGNRPGTGGGIPLSSDLTRWQFWWEFNKNPFIDLKKAVHATTIVTGSPDFYTGASQRGDAIDSLAPSEKQITDAIIPALAGALDVGQRDIVTACLVALAKIGRDHPDKGIDILALMRARLANHDQEIRETAALAMGISQMPNAIGDLASLALNQARGKELCRRTRVDHRTRSFACYGLGLIAHATNDPDDKRQCFEALAGVLRMSTERGVVDRNVPVAAISGLRLVRPGTHGAKNRALLTECLDVLWSYYTKKRGQGEQQIQAHVPPAIATLLGRGGDADGKFKERFLGELQGKFGKRRNSIYQSAAIALGLLAHRREVDPDDARYSQALLDHARRGKDAQARHFSMMALARIGGEANRTALLGILARGQKATVKPWAATALGVLAFESKREAGDGGRVDETIGHALLRELEGVKNDQTRSALAVALGLCEFEDAAHDLRALLEEYGDRDEFAGYLCIGLALMNDRSSIVDIQRLVESSVRRPIRLLQGAIALGKMGDKEVATKLQEMLVGPNPNVAKLAAISRALGFIGDRRSVRPLIDTLENPSLPPLSRAFAAAALGGVADKEPLPWNSKISVDINYRAAVETLTTSGNGVLDIL